MRIKALVIVYMGKNHEFPINKKEQEIEIGDGFSKERIEAELVKINEAANKKLRKAKCSCSMTLLEVGGVAV